MEDPPPVGATAQLDVRKTADDASHTEKAAEIFGMCPEEQMAHGGSHSFRRKSLTDDEVFSADASLSEIAGKLKEMDDQLAKLTELESNSFAQNRSASGVSDDEKAVESADEEEVERRSVYVGNVDYSSTPQEIQDHFKSCGHVNRVTIIVDKYSGHPKGFAYIEFAEPDSVSNALLLSDSMFNGRQIKVVQKRRNVPGMGRGALSRGRGFQRGVAPRGRGAAWPRASIRGWGRPFARGGFGMGRYGPRYRGRWQPGPRGPY